MKWQIKPSFTEVNDKIFIDMNGVILFQGVYVVCCFFSGFFL